MLARGGLLPVLTPALIGIGCVLIGMFVSTVRFCTWVRSFATHFIGLFCPILARSRPTNPERSRHHCISCRRARHVCEKRKAVGRRPSNSEKNQIERDELTGDWYPEPCEEPLSFQTEQRFVGVDEGEESDNDVWRIAIFMSPLDVHVNRSPIASEIIRMEHRTGKGLRRGPFLPAFKKESEFNERE